MDSAWVIAGSAFLFGVAGSAHCVGMCGPLAATAASFAARRESFEARMRAYLGLALVYNLARVASFTLLGVLAGGVVQGVVRLVSTPQASRAITLTLGGVMVLVGLLELTGLSGRLRWLDSARPVSRLVELLASRLSPTALVAMVGAATGLIPCGLLWAALAAAASTGSALSGGLFMLAFSLGAFPALFTLALVGAGGSRLLLSRLARAGALLAILLGLAILWRGYRGEMAFTMVHSQNVSINVGRARENGKELILFRNN